MPMLARLRRRLTLLAAVLTGSVVVAVAVFSFLLCSNLYTKQQQTAFEASVASFAAQWEQSLALDLDRIQDLNRLSKIQMYFEEDGSPLLLSGLSEPDGILKEFQALFQKAGFELTVPPLSSRQESCLLAREILQSEPVRLMAIKQTCADGWHLLVAWQPLAQEWQVLSRTAAGFFLVALVGIGLVSLLCWIVAGRAIRPAEQALHQQKEFVRAAGHELRTPLGVLRAGLAVLPGEAPEKAGRHIALLDREAVRMGRLIEQLLILSGGGMVNASCPQRLEPDTLLLSLAEEWEPLVKQCNRHLQVCLPEEPLPAVTVSREELCQILTIYLDNALQYAPPGSVIELGCTCVKHGVRWTVKDHGPGVPDPEKGQVFLRFWRSEPSRTDSSHFGLGLSVASELAERCHARVGVCDTPGGGASFWVEAYCG